MPPHIALQMLLVCVLFGLGAFGFGALFWLETGLAAGIAASVIAPLLWLMVWLRRGVFGDATSTAIGAAVGVLAHPGTWIIIARFIPFRSAVEPMAVDDVWRISATSLLFLGWATVPLAAATGWFASILLRPSARRPPGHSA